jgi:hypothetical protein
MDAAYLDLVDADFTHFLRDFDVVFEMTETVTLNAEIKWITHREIRKPELPCQAIEMTTLPGIYLPG